MASKKLLLHTCCAPCSTAVCERLAETYDDITLFYYNPCVFPESEYDRRLSELYRFAGKAGLPVIAGAYEHDTFLAAVKYHERDEEGGERCEICFRQRLEKTAAFAGEQGYDLFCTTLTVSPHKNAPLINRIAAEIGGDAALYGDFKKLGGYQRSVVLSRELGLYRQKYCGCEFSRN